MQGTNCDAKALIRKGLDFVQQEAWVDALQTFSEAAEVQPEHPIPYFYSSLAHLALNENEKAECSLEKGLKLAPENALGGNLAALIAFRENQQKEALTLLERFGLVEHSAVQAFLLLEIEKRLGEIGS